jgi:homoserine kinase type II
VHRVLRHVVEQGFTVAPAPLRTRQGDTIVKHAGHLWELTPWMPGVADYHARPTPVRLRAALTALARFHRAAATIPQVEARVGPSPAIAARRRQLAAIMSGGAAELQAALEHQRWPELADQARRWLKLLPGAAPRVDELLAGSERLSVSMQPCLRDIWHDHVLFTGDEVSGIVDFGALRIETVAGDVARLLGSLVEQDANGWHRGIAAYEALRALSLDERRLMAALDASGRLLSPANWFRWIFIEHRQFDNMATVVGRVEKQLAALAQWLQTRAIILP